MLTLIIWIPQLKKEYNAPTASVAKKGKSLWKSSIAWNVTLFMGCQSLIFYIVITWVPEILQSYGDSSSAAGWFLFLAKLAVIPVTFFIPVIAENMNNQVTLCIGNGALYILVSTGMLLGDKVFVSMCQVLLGRSSTPLFLALHFCTLFQLRAIAWFPAYFLKFLRPETIKNMQVIRSLTY